MLPSFAAIDVACSIISNIVALRAQTKNNPIRLYPLFPIPAGNSEQIFLRVNRSIVSNQRVGDHFSPS